MHGVREALKPVLLDWLFALWMAIVLYRLAAWAFDLEWALSQTVSTPVFYVALVVHLLCGLGKPRAGR